jgi:hypothetical protein
MQASRAPVNEEPQATFRSVEDLQQAGINVRYTRIIAQLKCTVSDTFSVLASN